MSSSARVTSLEAVRDFQAALQQFEETASAALGGSAMQIQRFLDWLEYEQYNHWKAELRKREERLNEAKTELNRKRIVATFGDSPHDTEEQIAFRKAKRMKEEAEEKLKIIVRWRQVIEHAVMEYKGQVQMLGTHLECEMPKSKAALHKIVARLEDYLDIPNTQSAPSETSSQAESASETSGPAG